MSAPIAAASSGPDQLLPQLMQLNRALAAHGTTTRPEVSTAETPEHVTVGRV
ncbi:MAG TPA: hypothetical protein VGJ09_03995 [Bryobacteraceae bacterium]